MFRVLKAGGRLAIANLHPMRSATGAWYRGPGGGLHVHLDRYFDEGPRQFVAEGLPHHQLSPPHPFYLYPQFSERRLYRCRHHRTYGGAKSVEMYPELDDELRVPSFYHLRLKK